MSFSEWISFSGSRVILASGRYGVQSTAIELVLINLPCNCIVLLYFVSGKARCDF